MASCLRQLPSPYVACERREHDRHRPAARARDPFDLVVEGTAAKVSDEARLRRVAEVYMTKYGWPVSVRDRAFYGDGAPTEGPPPYEV
jgi:hypothetical protein